MASAPPNRPRRGALPPSLRFGPATKTSDCAPPSNWRWYEWRDSLLGALERHDINASALAVAIVLSQFADNRTGESFPSIATIARRVGAKVDDDGQCKNVSRLLQTLKRAGLLEIKRRGRDQTNLYVPRSPLRVAGCHKGEIGTNLSPAVGQACPRDGETGTNLSPITGQICRGNLSHELSNLPLSLQAGDNDEPSGGEDNVELCDRFEELIGKYPFNEAMSRHAAWREFEKISIADQELAIREAVGYASVCKLRGVRHPRHAATWLRDREFDNARNGSKTSPLASVADVKAQSAGLIQPMVFVPSGTPAFDAWVKAGHKRLLDCARDESGRKTGWWFPSEFPPDHMKAAE